MWYAGFEAVRDPLNTAVPTRGILNLCVRKFWLVTKGRWFGRWKRVPPDVTLWGDGINCDDISARASTGSKRKKQSDRSRDKTHT